MAQPSLTVSTEGSGKLNFVGDWTLEYYHLLKQQLIALVEHKNLISANTEIDLTGLTRLDTVGCQLLITYSQPIFQLDLKGSLFNETTMTNLVD